MCPRNSETMKLISRSVQDTLAIGRALAQRMEAGSIVCLFGPLGSGKTVFTKGIAMGLGIPQEEVSSPTFVLIREYPKARIPLFHFDLYRLENKRQIQALGYEEYFYDEGVAVVEWAQRLGMLIPKEYLKVELSVLPGTKRGLEFTAVGEGPRRLLRRPFR